MKAKRCGTCLRKVQADNKGRLSAHVRWDWPGWPDFSLARSPEMHEIRCDGGQS